LPNEFVICTFSILSLDILFSESVEGSAVNTGSGNSIENSKPSNKPKPKPDLKITTGPTTEIEKDKEKIGKCTHDKLSLFKLDNKEDVNSTLCDFEGEFGKADHKAFDSVTDNAFVCDHCHGIMCKDCIEVYSDEE
jgi:hypothetical protein